MLFWCQNTKIIYIEDGAYFIDGYHMVELCTQLLIRSHCLPKSFSKRVKV